MSEVTYYKEEELNKLHKSKYGLQDEFVPEEYHSVYFDVNGDDCSVKAYCVNSIPSFCRVRKRWSVLEESPFKYVGFQNINNAYQQFNLIHLKVAWGACAFFFYVKYFDDDLGVYRYKWSDAVRGREKCRQHYFDTCYNIYKAQNKNRYKYYEENNNIDKFNTEFAKHHIESERKLIERTVNTKDIYEEYDKTLGIRQEAEEYLEWVRSTYLPSQAETTETDKRDDYLLNLFQKNEAIYDKFFERCEGKEKINIVIELIAVAIAIKSEDEYIAYLSERGKNFITLHKKLSKHFVLANYSSFAKAITEYKSIPKSRRYKTNTAKNEYEKLLPKKL